MDELATLSTPLKGLAEALAEVSGRIQDPIQKDTRPRTSGMAGQVMALSRSASMLCERLARLSDAIALCESAQADGKPLSCAVEMGQCEEL